MSYCSSINFDVSELLSNTISFRWQNSITDVSVTLRPPCWCPSAWAPTWRLHTKLYKFGWNTFPNNARMNYRTDLNLGEVVYIWIIFYIPVFWINLLTGYDFYFWWRDTANQPLFRFVCGLCDRNCYITMTLVWRQLDVYDHCSKYQCFSLKIFVFDIHDF